MSRIVVMLGIILVFVVVNGFKKMINSLPRITLQKDWARSHKTLSLSMSLPQLGGTILVTGIGESEKDEFMLSLLNEQKIWSSVVLATSDSVPTKKRFLSRTARYSGLLNVLEFATADISCDEQLQPLLEGTNAWVAFNVDQASITKYTDQAVAAGLKRVIFTLKLDPKDINTTVIPEFDTAVMKFSEVGAAFTGIRHGEVIEGDEDNPYEIVNASIPCLEDTVERGVLARITAELLLVEASANSTCGVCSSSDFAAAYLNVLRSSGLTRSQEVEKMFSGGLQRVARMTVKEYEARKQRAEEKKAARALAKLEEEQEEEQSRERAKKAALIPQSSGGLSLSNEEVEFIAPTDPEIISKRTEEILQSVWREYDARLYTKTSTKREFFDANRARATELAQKELDEEKAKKISELMEKRKIKETLERFVDSNRVQYSKLLALERKEMQNQKEISDVWVKYLYLLLEVTMAHCKAEGKLFHNMDEYAQTLLLRSQANTLRAQCGIQPYEVVYDPLDASVIVGKLSTQPLGLELGLDRPADDIVPSLEAKYGAVLKSVAALRGAAQIIELAIETLKKELPPPPPTVAELRATESQSKQKLVAQMRLAAIRNRGSPQTGEATSVVGRL